MPQPHQHKSGQRLHTAFARQAPLHLRLQVAQVHAAIHQQRAARSGQHRHCGRIELVFQFARQLLNGVFRGHQPHGRPILVDHDRQMPPPLLKVANQVQHRPRLRNHQHIPHHLAQLQLHKRSSGPRGRADIHQLRKILRVDHSHNMLRSARLVVYRNPRVLALNDLRAGLFHKHVGGQ